MNRKFEQYVVFALVGVTILVSCSANNPNMGDSENAGASSMNSPINNIAEIQEATLYPTQMAPTETITPPSITIENQCVSLVESFFNIAPEGVIVLGGSLVDLETGERVVLDNSGAFLHFAISTDQKILALKDPVSGKTLLLNSQGQRISEVEAPVPGEFVPRVWLDEDHLVLVNLNDRIG